MKNTTVALTIILLAASIAAAEPTIRWWGLTSFRQRNEISKEYTPTYSSSGGGILLHTTENNSTKIGYQIGLKTDVRENVTVGLTLRSGLSGNAQVMIQDIHNKDGLLPSIQEAYINWRTPYFDVDLGKIPQQGNALWDTYCGTLDKQGFRQDDPTDGIFNDRMAALNGVRLTRELGPVTLRGLYHTDYVAGYFTQFEDSTGNFDRARDRYVFMIGATSDFGAMGGNGTEIWNSALKGLSLDFDYGFPYRSPMAGTNPDSIAGDETIWGATIKRTDELSMFQVGYAYNWRDSVYTITFLDAIAQANIGNIARLMQKEWGDFTLTFRYQNSRQETEFFPYKGAEAVRTAYHLYANKSLWGLDFQPRIISFATEIEGFKQKTQTRYELTTTVRF